MFAAIRFRHIALVGVLCGIAFSGSEISAQLYCSPDWTPEYKCLEHCGPCGGASGGDSSDASGGSPGGAIGDIIRLPGDLIRLHNEAKARKVTALNDQGIAASDKKDWAAAEAYFRQAVKHSPNDDVFRRNLGITLGHEGEDSYRSGDYPAALNYFQQALANDPADDPNNRRTLNDDLAAVQSKIAHIRRDQEQRDKDKLAMQQSIRNLAQSLSTTPSSNTAPSSGGLDFNNGKSDNSSEKSGGLAFIDSNHPLKDAVADSHTALDSTQPNQGASRCTFGTRCNPANPNLAGPPPSGGGATSSTNFSNRVLDEARVAAGQGNVAQKNTSDPGASDAARHPFDTAGGVAAPMPVVAASPASAPVPDRIKNTSGYKTMAAEKEKLQNRMNQLDSRLTAIRAEQDKSSTPNQALVMEAAKIKQEMSPMRGEILLKQQEIDKFVVSMEEGSAPEKGKTKTPETAVPPPPHE